jgi:hypothetical protein
MIERLSAAAAGLFASLMAVPAMAQDAIPDLRGIWAGDYKLMRWNGEAEGVMQFRFIEQDGPLVKAEKSWQIKPGGTPGSVGGKLVTDAVEPMVGVIDFDGERFFLTEQGDGGVYTGRLVDDDTMEILYFEAGDTATAYRMTMRRSE